MEGVIKSFTSKNGIIIPKEQHVAVARGVEEKAARIHSCKITLQSISERSPAIMLNSGEIKPQNRVFVF